jgi:hypothetical protein
VENKSMKKNIGTSISLIIFIFCFLTKASSAAEIKTVEGIIKINWSNLQAVVQGEHLHAILSAYEDFSEKLKKNRLDSKNEIIDAYASKIENYNIAILYGSKGYTVIFDLKPSDKFKNIYGNTQTYQYIIDATTFQITR